MDQLKLKMTTVNGQINLGVGSIPRKFQVKNLQITHFNKTLHSDFDVIDGLSTSLVIGRDLLSRFGFKLHLEHFNKKVKSVVMESQSSTSIVDLPQEWKSILQKNSNLPDSNTCILPEAIFRIKTEPGKFSARPQYRVPIALKPIVDKQIEEWLNNNIIESAQIHTKWNNPLLVVPKKNGKFRVCIDATGLNKLVISEEINNMPAIRDIIEKCEKFLWASVIDLSSAFTQFEIEEEDRDKTCFTWNGKRYRFRKVPFGISTMPLWMQKILSKLLSKFCIIPFLDDILIVSNSYESHVRDVKLVLECLTNEARLKINMEKCQFFKSEFKLLGFRVNRDGIWPDNDRLQLIQNWPLPKTYKELERFLGVVNFHRSFSPQFASICAPLDHKSKKGQIMWDSQMSEAFEKVKQLFSHKLALQHIDFDKKFYLTTDASKVAVAGWLGQLDDNGNLQMVLCASKKLNQAQRNYATNKRELYGIIFCLQKFRHYLLNL